MLHKRKLQVSIVKDAPAVVNPDGAPVTITPEQIDEIVKAQVQNVAITIGALMLTKKAADTVSELILIAGRKYI